jgi:signal transduction histidine kinase
MSMAWWPLVIFGGITVGSALATAHSRYRRASGAEQRRMQWIGWAIAVWVEVVLVVGSLHLMVARPADMAPWFLGGSLLVAGAIAAGTHAGLVARVDHLLTHTVSLAGLTVAVLVMYVGVLVAVGRPVRGSERSLLLLSMLAAALATLVYIPARRRLADIANQFVYGEVVAPDETLRTFGNRLSRTIPLDELLLQMVESLRKSMNVTSAQCWTGSNGRYDLAAGVPHFDTPPLRLGAKELAIVARAGVSGGTWLGIWLPELVAPEHRSVTRVAPIAHLGQLLGLIVVARVGGVEFNEDEDRVLTELARQVGLALHNAQLDSALQASLEEVQRTNIDLVESRRRIVTAGDTERRNLERNLHDGAQQYLVAMAVKLRLAQDLFEEEPLEALDLIGELRTNMQDAIAELRALAHGIFPPLLSSGGLAEALPAAAGRAALPTEVNSGVVHRYDPEVEASVYFCCMEALQNAGKHAGDSATAVVEVGEVDDILRFEVRDDGVGFVLEAGQATGHGFVNMTDRLGAVGGRLTVSSAPGRGTRICGEIPIVVHESTDQR